MHYGRNTFYIQFYFLETSGWVKTIARPFVHLSFLPLNQTNLYSRTGSLDTWWKRHNFCRGCWPVCDWPGTPQHRRWQEESVQERKLRRLEEYQGHPGAQNLRTWVTSLLSIFFAWDNSSYRGISSDNYVNGEVNVFPNFVLFFTRKVCIYERELCAIIIIFADKSLPFSYCRLNYFKINVSKPIDISANQTDYHIRKR